MRTSNGDGGNVSIITKRRTFSAPPGFPISEGCRFLELRSGLGSEIDNGLLNEGVDWTAGTSLSIPAFVF